MDAVAQKRGRTGDSDDDNRGSPTGGAGGASARAPQGLEQASVGDGAHAAKKCRAEPVDRGDVQGESGTEVQSVGGKQGDGGSCLTKSVTSAADADPFDSDATPPAGADYDSDATPPAGAPPPAADESAAEVNGEGVGSQESGARDASPGQGAVNAGATADAGAGESAAPAPLAGSAADFFAALDETESRKPQIGTVHAKDSAKVDAEAAAAAEVEGTRKPREWVCQSYHCGITNPHFNANCRKCGALRRAFS